MNDKLNATPPLIADNYTFFGSGGVHLGDIDNFADCSSVFNLGHQKNNDIYQTLTYH